MNNPANPTFAMESQGAHQTSRVMMSNVIGTRALAQIAVFSGLIAFATSILSTSFLAIPLPYPLYEITAAPAFYFAISVLYPRRVSFWSTAIGSAIGEAINVFVTNPSAGNPIFVPGIVWARAPEALIIYYFRNRSMRWLGLSMALATIYETVAFYIPDSLFYAYALFSYSTSPQGLTSGFVAAVSDVGTLIDLAWIPVAIGLIVAVRKAYKTDFLS
jgi:hypothetical protein